MNLWGFSLSFLRETEHRFPEFLSADVPKNPAKAEYFLPRTVSELLDEEKATVKVLYSADKWYGVTYAEDKKLVVSALQEMTRQGLYPEGLWK